MVNFSRLVYALAAFVLFLELGFYVKGHGEPAIFVFWERAWVDHSTLIAWWLTWACYPYVLVPLAVALAVVAWRVPEWRSRIVFSLVLLVVCWQGADLFQHVFARPRRMDWVVKHETAFSYPSSHAAIATGFYGLWAVLVARSDWPQTRRIVTASLLAVLAVAICWSRLALGAHYVTDLLGGALLAIGAVLAASAFVPERRHVTR
ncbi:MAG: phosphatase PAP2 family protein [Candidatus Eremiobacteraeota bacterium]|nr:phosphatase PAP2 family protein [Candidatus Eremiobacteraeota bacterium]MBV8374513.1 phosphatase PAP2 family protein [Candidatus Eremiobacteraeota bacterium]